MYKYVLLLKTIIQKHSHHSNSESSEFIAIPGKTQVVPGNPLSHRLSFYLIQNSSSICPHFPGASNVASFLLNAYQPKRLNPKIQMNRITFRRTKFSVIVSSRLLLCTVLKDRQNTMRLVGHQWLSLVQVKPWQVIGQRVKFLTFIKACRPYKD